MEKLILASASANGGASNSPRVEANQNNPLSEHEGSPLGGNKSPRQMRPDMQQMMQGNKAGKSRYNKVQLQQLKSMNGPLMN